MSKEKLSESKVKVVESCPLDSKFGHKWNSDIREKISHPESDFSKAEFLRRLAGDANFRSAAFASHGQYDKALVARFVSIFILCSTFLRKSFRILDDDLMEY
jgi:hypothetical protein